MAKIKTSEKGSKKEAIRKTAEGLFRTSGYNATSMRHLAEAVGVEAASLYNHISGKEELLADICFNVAAAFNTHMEATLASNVPHLQKVEAIIRFHIKMMMDEFEAVYVSNRDWKHLSEPQLGNFLNQRREYERKFSGIIEAGITAREIKPVHPQVAVLTILSAVRGIEFWQRNKRDVSAKQVEKDIVTLLVDGMST